MKPCSAQPERGLPLLWHTPAVPPASSRHLQAQRHTGGLWCPSPLALQAAQTLLIHGKCEMPQVTSAPAQKHYSRASCAMLAKEAVSTSPGRAEITPSMQQARVKPEFIEH